MLAFSLEIATENDKLFQLEHPAQEERMKKREEFHQNLMKVEDSLINLVLLNDADAKALFEKYVQGLDEYHGMPDEIKWDMLASSAFVNAVSSTTGDYHTSTRSKVLDL